MCICNDLFPLAPEHVSPCLAVGASLSYKEVISSSCFVHFSYHKSLKVTAFITRPCLLYWLQSFRRWERRGADENIKV